MPATEAAEALTDCEGNVVAENNDACRSNGMPRFTADLYVTKQPYYLIVDGFAWDKKGAFNIALAYQ